MPQLELYGLTREQPFAGMAWNECLQWFEYAIPPNNPQTIHASCLTRDYIGHHLLNADGTLTLVNYEYPNWTDDTPSILEKVNLAVTGNFWLIMREFSFSTQSTYIPFRDGVIVESCEDWFVDDYRPINEDAG